MEQRQLAFGVPVAELLRKIASRWFVQQTLALQVLDSLPPDAAFTVAQGGSVSFSEYGATVISVSSGVAGGLLSAIHDSWGYRSDPRQVTDQEVLIQLVGDSPLIDRVVLTGDASERSLDAFSVSVSETESGPFTTVTSGNLEQDAAPHEFGFTPIRARYVRLELVSNHGAADQLRLNRLDVRGRPKQGGIVSLL
ncbi:MAG: hypothetical protein HY791_10070, partial [Deltaproteobacteria bacterium]|nr:hypothetical protein [Deltaproteobacteria bacterium]